MAEVRDLAEFMSVKAPRDDCFCLHHALIARALEVRGWGQVREVVRGMVSGSVVRAAVR